MIALLLLFFVALGAGVLSGVVGTGSSLIMLPVLVATYGPRIAVPVMAIASLFGNIGRAIVGFMTGFVLSTGPLSVPVFTGYGMSGGVFLGSEAASAILLYAGKLATFGISGALAQPVLTHGLAIGIALFVGSMIAKRLVQKLQTHTFELLIDAVLVAGAVGMILALK